MTKKACILLSLLALLFLTGCHEEASIPESVIAEYDLEQAAALIDEVEWLTAWLQTQETIDRTAAENLVERVNTVLLFEGSNVITCTLEDAAYWGDESMDVLPLGSGNTIPTIYHQDIELVSALRESSCVLDEKTGECINHYNDVLTIRKEYTGSDPEHQGWYLEYVFSSPFEHGSDEDWDFVSYNGTYNLIGNLPLRADFNPEKYPAP